MSHIGEVWEYEHPANDGLTLYLVVQEDVEEHRCFLLNLENSQIGWIPLNWLDGSVAMRYWTRVT